MSQKIIYLDIYTHMVTTTYFLKNFVRFQNQSESCQSSASTPVQWIRPQCLSWVLVWYGAVQNKIVCRPRKDWCCQKIKEKNLHTSIIIITCILDTVRNAAKLAVYVAIITLQKNQNPARRILLDKAFGASPSPVRIQYVLIKYVIAQRRSLRTPGCNTFSLISHYIYVDASVSNSVLFINS